MRPRFAESLLALFTTRSRAANVVGDLLEESSPHGGVWFWAQVTRTSAGLLAGQVADAPVRLLLIWIASQILVILGESMIWGLSVPGWYPIVLYLCAKLLPFLVGLGAAVLSRGREVSFALVLGLVDGKIGLLIYLNAYGEQVPWSAAFSVMPLLCYLGAALLVRRQVGASGPPRAKIIRA